MAVAVGIFPVTGLPLPFISMGGTSFIFTGMSLGIIISVYRGYSDLADDNIEGNAIKKAEKKNIDLVAAMCANMLEECCFDLYPQLAELKKYIQSLDIGHVCLSGSGSTVYCLLRDVSDEDVKHYQKQIKETCGCESLVVYNNRW